MGQSLMVKVNYAAAIFNEPNVFRKIEMLRKHSTEVLEMGQATTLAKDYVPNRDAEMVHPKYHPPKPGFSTPKGQARMLHDLASIELQAMELGLRTLTEFADAPIAFKEELMNITLSESTHLEMCLLEIEKLGSKWGDWPIHQSLWKATSDEDSLLDRILIVHRYLEGSGLDAGDTLFRRLALIDCPTVKKAVHQITHDEVGHVEFGSRWYRQICALEKVDPNQDYRGRMNKLIVHLPKRLEPLAVDLRKQAGFSDEEILYLQDLRTRQLNHNVRP
jgi:uncharacterized ferritin-like protein (DUF455 family)